jgi:hypothetical protein
MFHDSYDLEHLFITSQNGKHLHSLGVGLLLSNQSIKNMQWTLTSFWAWSIHPLLGVLQIWFPFKEPSLSHLNVINKLLLKCHHYSRYGESFSLHLRDAKSRWREVVNGVVTQTTAFVNDLMVICYCHLLCLLLKLVFVAATKLICTTGILFNFCWLHQRESLLWWFNFKTPSTIIKLPFWEQ